MNLRDIAIGVTDAIEQADWDRARQYMAPGFRFFLEFPRQSMTIDEWIAFSTMLKTAFPDLSYNFRILGTGSDRVRVESAFVGTHTEPLDLSMMGGPVIQPTGKRIIAPEESADAEVDGNMKVTSITVRTAPDTGLAYMFRQIGIPIEMLG